MRGPSASEQRRAIARRQSAFPPAPPAVKLVGSAVSLAGSFRRIIAAEAHRDPPARLTRGTPAPGSPSVARAALGWGRRWRWRRDNPAPPANARPIRRRAGAAPAAPLPAAASDGPSRPVGNTNRRTAAEVADSAAEAGSPQPIVTSGVINLSLAQRTDRRGEQRGGFGAAVGRAASTSSWASLIGHGPRTASARGCGHPQAAVTVRSRRARPGTRERLRRLPA